MKFLLLVLIFVLPICVCAQNLTGIWRGEFNIEDKKKSINENKFKFELQILQKEGGNLRGVTYTYKSKEYYGKAEFKGNILWKSNSVVINELKITEVEKNDKTDICLMFCNLKYSNDLKGNEILIGTFTSKKISSNQFCFNGKVFLKKVKSTSFPKEIFLLTPIKKKIDTVSYNNSTKIINDNLKQLNLQKVEKPQLTHEQNEIVLNNPTDELLSKRENILIANIKVSLKDIKILIYDNGIIDNDTISIFLNNSKIIDKKRVSTIPIIFELSFTSQFQKHEIIATAENMGEIPPNTALIIIQAGKERIEVPIMADYKKNAKINIEYNVQYPFTIKRY